MSTSFFLICFPVPSIHTHLTRPSLIPLSSRFLPCTPSLCDVLSYFHLFVFLSVSLSLLTPSLPSFSHLLFCFIFFLPPPFLFSSFLLVFSPLFVFVPSLFCFFVICVSLFLPAFFSILPCFLLSSCVHFSFMSSLSHFLPPPSFPCPLASFISSSFPAFLPSFFSIFHLFSFLSSSLIFYNDLLQ